MLQASTCVDDASGGAIEQMDFQVLGLHWLQTCPQCRSVQVLQKDM